MLPEVELTRPQGDPAGGQLTRNQTASLLGISLATVDKLVKSGYLPSLESSLVLHLAATPFVTVTTGILPVLRTAAAKPANDGRAFMGDAAHLTDRQFRDGNAAWWRSDPDTIVGAGVLAVSIASFVTGVLHIHDVARTRRIASKEVRHAYKATVAGRVGMLGAPETNRILTKDPDLATLTRQLLGMRVRTISGGPIAYLTA